jgi:hypothetical protein
MRLTPQLLRYWASCLVGIFLIQRNSYPHHHLQADHHDGVDIDTPPNAPDFHGNADIDDIARLATRRRKTLEESQVPNITVNVGGIDSLTSELRNFIKAQSPETARNHPQTFTDPTHHHSVSLPVAARLDLDDPRIKTEYHLKEETISKLRAIDVTGLHVLSHVTDTDLKEAHLSVGERADVRWAENAWRCSL